MNDFIAGVLFGMAVLWIVQWIVSVVLQRYINQQLAEIETILVEQKKQQSISARVELINNCFYIYNDDTGEFLVQGKDLAEMDRLLKQRWPDRDVTVYVRKDNGGAYAQLKQTQ
jgi:hypothetical protein